jgi:hypothetical protein
MGNPQSDGRAGGRPRLLYPVPVGEVEEAIMRPNSPWRSSEACDRRLAPIGGDQQPGTEPQRPAVTVLDLDPRRPPAIAENALCRVPREELDPRRTRGEVAKSRACRFRIDSNLRVRTSWQAGAADASPGPFFHQLHRVHIRGPRLSGACAIAMQKVVGFDPSAAFEEAPLRSGSAFYRLRPRRLRPSTARGARDTAATHAGPCEGVTATSPTVPSELLMSAVSSSWSEMILPLL